MGKVIITEEIFEAGKSINGGWSNTQLGFLGITPAQLKVSGWKKDAIGREVEQCDIDKFVAYKDRHLSSNKIKRIKEKKNLPVDSNTIDLFGNDKLSKINFPDIKDLDYNKRLSMALNLAFSDSQLAAKCIDPDKELDFDLFKIAFYKGTDFLRNYNFTDNSDK